jgi:hypothetical protein
MRNYCIRAGERHLVAPASSETAFKRAAKEAGYLVQVGETASWARFPQTRPASRDGKRGETGVPSANEAGEASALSIGQTVAPASDTPQAVEAQAGD